MAVIQTNILSMILKRNMDCTVVLPDNIKQDEKPLKVVWLYHGSSGDHKAWLYHVPIAGYANERHIAFVLPNVHESCFVDMNIGAKYGRYVGKELPQIIWKMFPVLSKIREDNYVAGYSNGGYGCFHTALTYPEYYGMVGAFSAGDKADADFPNDGGAKSIHRIRLFGEGDLNQNAYGLKYIGNQLINQNRVKPIIYHACGGRDPWLEANHIMRDYFLARQEYYQYTYDEIAELGHEWKFWDEELNRFLDFAGIGETDENSTSQ